MKKRYSALLALLFPGLAFAQSYPSPTFENATIRTALNVTGTGLTSLTSQGGAVFGIDDFRKVTILENIGGFGASGSRTFRVNRGSSKTTDDYVSISTWTITHSGANTAPQVNQKVNTTVSVGANAGETWGWLSTLHTNANSDLAGVNHVAGYSQVVRDTVPGGKVGVNIEGHVIEARSLTGASSATDGAMRTLELDMFAAGADDLAGLGREVMPIVLGKGQASDAPPTISSIIGIYGAAGYTTTVGKVLHPEGNITISHSIVSSLGTTLDAAANVVWMKTGHSMAFDTAGVTRLSSDATTVNLLGAFKVGASATQNAITITPGATTATAAVLAKSGSGDLTLPGSVSITGGGIVTMPKLLLGNGATVSWAGSTTPTGLAFQRLSGNVSGAPTSGTVAYNYWSIASDVIDGSAASLANPAAFRIDHNMGGGAARGGRGGIIYSGNINGAQADLPADNPQWFAMASWFQASVNVGGTNLGALLTTNGVMFGGYDQATFNSGATFWRGLVGREIDITAKTGSSVFYKLGLQIVLLSSDVVQGVSAGDDQAISINNQYTQTASKGWKTAIGIGRSNGSFPLDPTGSVMAAFTTSGTMLAANGIDLSAITFSTTAFKSTGFSVDGSGNAIISVGYTVAALPTCNAGATGMQARVSDATAPTYNGALTGGGAIKVPVYCNGTSWTSH